MKISVALCTFNGARYLEAQLRSYINQSRMPHELVVVDDASTDESLQVLENFRKDCPFEVRVHQNRNNLGVVPSFERAFHLCSGDVIFPSDQDDVWLPSKIQKMTSLFADPIVEVVACNASLVDANLTPMGTDLWRAVRLSLRDFERLQRGQAFERLIEGNFVAGMAMAVRTRFLLEALPVPQGWMHDAWLALNAAASDAFRAIPESLVSYRLHGKNAMGVGSVSLWGHLKRASRLPPQTLVVRANELQSATERLSSQLSTPRIAALSERIFHLNTRGKMPPDRLSRLPLVARELWTGRYRRCSLGLVTACRDLLRSMPSGPPGPLP